MLRNTSMRISMGIAVCLTSLGMVTVSADDTEIFFAPEAQTTTEAISSNILFMLDTSGSMNEFDGTDATRMTRMKRAIYELLDSGDDINMGVGAFNGDQKGGSILYPVKNLGEDLCPGFTCDSVTVHSRVSQSTDDASESVDGTVTLDNQSVVLVGGTDQPTTVGLRFPDLNVPRGATITQAQITFISNAGDTDTTDLVLSAHASGDSPAFASSSNNISDRLNSIATVSWSPPAWSMYRVPYNTPNISGVVQEIVDRSDWCGGNAISIMVDGSGNREAFSFDNNPSRAPVLKVSYDPSTIDMQTTCVAQSQSVRIADGLDDAVEEGATGVVRHEQTAINLGGDEASAISGFRFLGIDIPQNAIVRRAHLEFLTAEASSDSVSLEISAEAAGNSSAFNPVTTSELSDRANTASRVQWTISDSIEENTLLRSPDVSAILQELISGGTWTSGNAISMFLGVNAVTGERNVHSFDGSEQSSARLVLDYQLESPASSGVTVKLQTARDEIRKVVGEIQPRGFTPIVDMYYEAAAYMRGDAVEYGRQRGDQLINDRWFRLSHPDTYSQGALVRHPDCSEYDLNSRDCLNEEIQGNPIYNSPIESSCQVNQVVLLSDGFGTKQSSSQLVKDLVGAPTCEATGTNAAQFEQCAYELADWLKTNDQSDLNGMQYINTHTIGFNFSSSFLSTLAQRGGGNFYEASSSSDLSSVFRNIVREVADVNSSFVAPSASVSQINRLSNRNDVYYAVFKPSLSTNWRGNLKRYSLGKTTSSDEVTVLDREGNEVFDTATGATLSSAKSYWHTDTDGDDVTKGGAASQLESTRPVITALPDSTGVLQMVDLYEGNLAINKALLGIDAQSDEYRISLLQWARGLDVNDADDNGNINEARAQMGDPLHSQPAIINYDTDDTTEPESVIFLGTNEGYLHAFDTDDGEELFAYMPQSLLPNIDVLFNNNLIDNKPYGVDGNTTVWVDDKDGDNQVDDDESAYAVVGLRRGGQEYHALNVTDPYEPTLAWSISNAQSDFAELGQSWSTPVKTLMRIEGEVKHVLVIGGGYDPVNDDRTDRVASDTMGRAIYIVDAVTGELIESITGLEQPDMVYSIPSKITVLDLNTDGLADRLYVGDMGGQLWRFDIEQGNDTGDSLTINGDVIAVLGDDSLGGNRRFFYEPDVSLQNRNGRQYLAIAIGSGWRAHPLDLSTQDRFYVLYDGAVFAPPRNEFDVIEYSSVTDSELYNASDSSTSTDTSDLSDNGWFIDLSNTGEKIISSPLTIGEQFIFTSYLPPTELDVCNASVGNGRVYVIDSATGLGTLDADETLTVKQKRYTRVALPGIPPSPSILFPAADDGNPSLFVGGQRVSNGFSAGPLLKRTHWYESSADD